MSTDCICFDGKEIRPVKGCVGYFVDADGDLYTSWTRTGRDGKVAVLGAIRKLRVGRRSKSLYLHTTTIFHVRLSVHVAVLGAFAGLRPAGMVARHLNGDRRDNRAENLCWGTQKENIADNIRHGTIPSGERHGMAKLTLLQVQEIRRLHGLHGKAGELAHLFLVTRKTIQNIVSGRSWKL